MKLWYVTLGFTPNINEFVVGDDLESAIKNTVEILKAQGNEVDQSIIIRIEAVTNLLEMPKE